MSRGSETRRWTMTALACALALAPAGVAGQARYDITPFAASNGAVYGRPVVSGLSVTVYSGGLAVRPSLGIGWRTLRGWTGLGAGPSLITTSDGSTVTEATPWTADLDVVLSPTRLSSGLRRLAGGTEPTLFVGAGANGGADADGRGSWAPTFSYGAGLDVPLAPWLAVQSQARWRMTVEDLGPRSPGFNDGLEYRVGLSLRLGHAGRGRSGPVAPPRRVGGYEGGTGAAPVWSAPSDADRDRMVERVLDSAADYLGVRYRWGGEDPRGGFDCSGFVQYVFSGQGVRLPRTSRQQARVGEPLPTSVDAARAGDLLFFASDGYRVDHVAIYVGDGRIIHSSESGGGVRYDNLRSPRGTWYIDHLVAARRPLDAASRGGLISTRPDAPEGQRRR